MMLALAWWLVFWDCSGAGTRLGQYWPKPFDDMDTCMAAGRTMQRWEHKPFACRETVPEGAQPIAEQIEARRQTEWH